MRNFRWKLSGSSGFQPYWFITKPTVCNVINEPSHIDLCAKQSNFGKIQHKTSLHNVRSPFWFLAIMTDYVSALLVSDCVATMEGWVMIWEEFGEYRSWPNQDTVLEFSQRYWGKPRMISVRITMYRPRFEPNTSPEHYRYVRPDYVLT